METKLFIEMNSEDKFILAHYKTTPVNQMAKMIGRSECFVHGHMNKLGIDTPAEVKIQFRKANQFKKGIVPHNKGKKMSAEMYAKCAATMFKKGNIPPQTKARDGIITIRRDNSDTPYKFIRVSLGKWELYHRYRWEKFRGKIPKMHMVVFKDGNTMNCKMDNLELITMAENMKRNSFHNWPEPLEKMVQLRRQLNRQINKHLKKLHHEKQD